MTDLLPTEYSVCFPKALIHSRLHPDQALRAYYLQNCAEPHCRDARARAPRRDARVCRLPTQGMAGVNAGPNLT